jgi:predicted nuclease of predicted toxin-antitoxin system
MTAVMRLLTNENIPTSVVDALRDRGHDVLAVKESMRGAGDRAILARAQSESRLVVTQDKDFGELAFRLGLPAECGIVLFRLTGDDPDADIRRIVEVIDSRTDWPGQFAVVTDDRIRMRLLPTKR